MAHDALHIVFNLHAGFLQSYEVDECKRVLRSYWLVYDTDEDVDFICRGYEDLSEEARVGVDAAALEEYRESIEMLLRIASNYVAAPLRHLPTDIDAAEATFAAFRDGIATRLVHTQPSRVRRVLDMLEEFDFSYEFGFPGYRTMYDLRGRVQYIIPDLGWAQGELHGDDYVGEWLSETMLRLRRNN